MNSIFKNGKNLSPNVEGALRYVARVGVMSKEVWTECFANGAKRWSNRQLQILIENKLLKFHNCNLGNYYVLGEYGSDIAKKLNWSLVDPVNPNQLRHDEVVGHGLWRLEKQQICKNWIIEKELKIIRDSKLALKDQGNQIKYPDAVFEAHMGGAYRGVALEYERNGKTIPRYRSILWSYHGINRFSMVLFIVENDTLKKRIKYSLKQLGRVALIEQIGFVDVNEWQNDPAKALIELASTKTSFERLSNMK